MEIKLRQPLVFPCPLPLVATPTSGVMPKVALRTVASEGIESPFEFRFWRPSRSSPPRRRPNSTNTTTQVIVEISRVGNRGESRGITGNNLVRPDYYGAVGWVGCATMIIATCRSVPLLLFIRGMRESRRDRP
jgi:hypothetical protein